MRSRSRGQRGVTLMEMTVVVALFTVLFFISYTLLEDSVQTSLFVEEHNDLPIYGQAAVNTIQRELLQSRVVFEGSAASTGPGYFNALTFPTTFPLLSGSKMPVLNPTSTSLVPDDPAIRYTGNCLLVAKQLPPAVITGLTGTGGTTLLVDRYQFQVFYLTQRFTHGFAGQNYFIDAIQAKSDIYADYSQLTQWAALGTTIATDRTKVATQLNAYTDPVTGASQPSTKAWNSGAAAPAAFYTISASMGFTAINSPTIALPTSASLVKGLSGGRVSGKMDYTIGYRPSGVRFNLNTDVKKADGSIQVRDPIPKYAAFDSTVPNFPSGMEFLIVGPAGSRRILSRIVILASYIGHIDSKESLVITSGSS
ncbi:MAG: prepilin-type N-terminal cleavage/methylation domain-containing protein [Thermoanaerobaculia bacterium]